MHNLVITSVHVISSIIVIGVDISNTVRGSYQQCITTIIGNSSGIVIAGPIYVTITGDCIGNQVLIGTGTCIGGTGASCVNVNCSQQELMLMLVVVLFQFNTCDRNKLNGNCNVNYN